MPKLPNIHIHGGILSARDRHLAELEKKSGKEQLATKIKLHKEIANNSKERIDKAIKGLQIKVNKLVKKKHTTDDFRILRGEISIEFREMKKKMNALIRS